MPKAITACVVITILTVIIVIYDWKTHPNHALRPLTLRQADYEIIIERIDELDSFVWIFRKYSGKGAIVFDVVERPTFVEYLKERIGLENRLIVFSLAVQYKPSTGAFDF